MTSTPTQNTSPGRYWLDIALDTQDPHSMTGAAVTGLLAILVDHEEAEGNAESANDDYLELRAEYDDLEAEAGRRAQVIDEILAAIKKSTSKLSDQIRAIVDESIVAHAGMPATEPDPAQPADDASVEEWQEYARAQGHLVDESLNRSQIRTLLSLPNGSPE